MRFGWGILHLVHTPEEGVLELEAIDVYIIVCKE
jgi:hypothetical protein